MKIQSIFERVNDASSIYKVERKINNNLKHITLLFFIMCIVEFVLIIVLLPLKEKEPYLVSFSPATQSFVIIEKADRTITNNEALIRSLAGAYILNRETINQVDEKTRFEEVRLQSSKKVWSNFEILLQSDNSIYINKSLRRDIEVVNIAKWSNGTINADISVRLFNTDGNLESEKRYKIILIYKFTAQKLDFASIPKNPTGFQVTDYAVTEISTIKSIDESRKVANIRKKDKDTEFNPNQAFEPQK